MSIYGTADTNMSENCSVATVCHSASVMSSGNNNYVFCGTPFGVPFFAFSRFIGFAFYFFYYYGLFKKCSSALFKADTRPIIGVAA